MMFLTRLAAFWVAIRPDISGLSPFLSYLSRPSPDKRLKGPDGNCAMQILISLISAQWTDERNRMLPETVESILRCQVNYNMDTESIIIVSSLGAAILLLFILVMVLFVQLAAVKSIVREMQVTGRIRVQKLKMNSDKNHAFHNPGLVPDEELSRRGFSMHQANDVETGRYSERQAGGQFVEELSREIDQRLERISKTADSTPPPFLLQSIEENKRRTRTLVNPNANPNGNGPGRQSETNPNFIY